MAKQGEERGWYQEEVENITPEARQLLEQYSHIEPSKVVPHVLALRDKAFKIWSYACIGQLRFVTPNLPHLPPYEEVLSRLRSGATFLDAGCCFGQEIRSLVQAGIPSSQLYGFDLEQRFTDLGYELFQDRDRLQATFLSGDVLAEPGSKESGQLDELLGKIDIVLASSFLHVWDWDDMLVAIKRLVSFTKPQAGSMVVGRQMGSSVAGSFSMPTKKGSNYRHNVESMQKMWKQLGAETGTEWKVEGSLYEAEELRRNMHLSWAEPNMCALWFTATRQ